MINSEYSLGSRLSHLFCMYPIITFWNFLVSQLNQHVNLMKLVLTPKSHLSPDSIVLNGKQATGRHVKISGDTLQDVARKSLCAVKTIRQPEGGRGGVLPRPINTSPSLRGARTDCGRTDTRGRRVNN